MNKFLLVFLVLIFIAAGVFYFVYFVPSSQASVVAPSQVAKVDTNFNLVAIDELSESFATYGNIPVTVNPASLRKNNPAKANDPFYN